MKTFYLIVLLTVAISTNAIPQNFAHVHTAKLMTQMPAYKLAQLEMEKFTLAKEKELRDMEQVLQLKISKYEQSTEEVTEALRLQIEKEMMEMQNSLLQFKKSAEKKIEEKEQELTDPIYDKVGKAIIKVANEQGYDYVIDESIGSLIVVPKSRDLMALVKRELGIL
ncbi:MAG: outer membrane protein [Parvicellaceae bacterium]|jgi:outer membrane protein